MMDRIQPETVTPSVQNYVEHTVWNVVHAISGEQVKNHIWEALNGTN